MEKQRERERETEGERERETRRRIQSFPSIKRLANRSQTQPSRTERPRSVSQSVMSLERGQSVMTVCFMGRADG